MLQYGFSKPWTEQLKEFTGTDRYNATPLLEYFQPLMKFLKKFNEENKLKVGWEEKCPEPPSDAQKSSGGQSSASLALIIIIIISALILIVIGVILVLLATKIGWLTGSRGSINITQDTNFKVYVNKGFI